MKYCYIDLSVNHNREYLREACELGLSCLKVLSNNIKGNWVDICVHSKMLHHTLRFKEENARLTNHEYKKMSEIKFINSKIINSDRDINLTINERCILHMLVSWYINTFENFINENHYYELHKLLLKLD